MPQLPSERYAGLVRSGAIAPDPAQEGLAERLSGLASELMAQRRTGFRSIAHRLFSGGAKRSQPRGLYIHGDVGRGKTMLVDIFFQSLAITRKRRAHFNDFMADVHERVHTFRQALRRGEAKGDDPIAPVAAEIARESRLICLDELHVDDIADAMILGRLFRALFANGAVVVATSNAAPDDLYAGGLNRALFVPFIALIKEHMDVVRLEAASDYRLDKLGSANVYFTPLGAQAREGMDAAWRRLTGTEHGEPAELRLKGRALHIPQSAMGAARFTFAELCLAPLGPNDFLAIARAYHTVLIDDVPMLSEAHRNHVRRFVLLIDTLYDHRVKLILSAAAEPADLYPDGRLRDEFRRTESRLMEMRGRDYLAAAHGTRGPAGADQVANGA